MGNPRNRGAAALRPSPRANGRRSPGVELAQGPDGATSTPLRAMCVRVWLKDSRLLAGSQLDRPELQSETESGLRRGLCTVVTGHARSDSQQGLANPTHNTSLSRRQRFILSHIL